MKRLFLLLTLPIFIGFASCTQKYSADEVTELVMAGEIERLPLLKQEMLVVDDITIDSMCLLIDDEPMSGYLYTTWIADNDSTPIIVEVDKIRRSLEHKGYIEWKSDWNKARIAYAQNLLSSIF